MIEQADYNPQVYKAVGKNCVPISTITLYLKNEPSSQTLNFMLCINLERSHLATAAEPHWKADERHMEKQIVAVHLLFACELNPVLVAISCLSGAEAKLSVCAADGKEA